MDHAGKSEACFVNLLVYGGEPPRAGAERVRRPGTDGCQGRCGHRRCGRGSELSTLIPKP